VVAKRIVRFKREKISSANKKESEREREREKKREIKVKPIYDFFSFTFKLCERNEYF